MSRFIARTYRSLISLVAVTAVAAATSSVASTSHRSLEEVVTTPVFHRAPDALCSRNSSNTTYSSRMPCLGGSDVRQLFITGQVIPAGVGVPIGFAQLTPALQREYRLDPEQDYLLAAGYLYVVDHRTKAVLRIIPVEQAR